MSSARMLPPVLYRGKRSFDYVEPRVTLVTPSIPRSSTMMAVDGSHILLPLLFVLFPLPPDNVYHELQRGSLTSTPKGKKTYTSWFRHTTSMCYSVTNARSNTYFVFFSFTPMEVKVYFHGNVFASIEVNVYFPESWFFYFHGSKLTDICGTFHASKCFFRESVFTSIEVNVYLYECSFAFMEVTLLLLPWKFYTFMELYDWCGNETFMEANHIYSIGAKTLPWCLVRFRLKRAFGHSTDQVCFRAARYTVLNISRIYLIHVVVIGTGPVWEGRCTNWDQGMHPLPRFHDIRLWKWNVDLVPI